MTFQDRMNEVIQLWEEHPLPEDFKAVDQNKLLCSVDGVISQLDNLPGGGGAGTIYIAVNDGNDNVSIRTITVFKS